MLQEDLGSPCPVAGSVGAAVRTLNVEWMWVGFPGPLRCTQALTSTLPSQACSVFFKSHAFKAVRLYGARQWRPSWETL